MLAVEYYIVSVSYAYFWLIGDPLIKGMEDPFDTLRIQVSLICIAGDLPKSTADVAPLHRFVPDECLFSFQGACLLLCCDNLVVTGYILSGKEMILKGLGVPAKGESLK